MFGKLLTHISAAAVAFAIGIIVTVNVGTDWRAYTVYGGSMEPHYSPGDLIFASAAEPESVQPGQIIVFSADWASEQYDRRVVHRVVATGTVDGTPVAMTRGDANTISDPDPVSLAGEFRVVRFEVPGGALWIDRAAQPYSWLLAAAVGLLALSLLRIAKSSSSARDLRRNALRPRVENGSETAPR